MEKYTELPSYQRGAETMSKEIDTRPGLLITLLLSWIGVAVSYSLKNRVDLLFIMSFATMIASTLLLIGAVIQYEKERDGS